MKSLIASLVLLIVSPFFSGATASQAPPPRIGQVFIVGNVRTQDVVILRRLNVYPGQVLSYVELRQAQKNLERLGIFKPGSVKVTAEDDSNNPASQYKNVFVKVEETSTGSLRLMSGLNALGEPVVSLVWEERNFDPLRLPTSLDDLIGGDAFLGGGRLLRLELVQIPTMSLCVPRFLQVGGFLAPVGG